MLCVEAELPPEDPALDDDDDDDEDEEEEEDDDDAEEEEEAPELPRCCRSVAAPTPRPRGCGREMSACGKRKLAAPAHPSCAPLAPAEPDTVLTAPEARGIRRRMCSSSSSSTRASEE
jgi:hypothetical protein